MISKIKNDLIDKKGKLLKFRYNGSRNQIDEFEGTIVGLYDYVFTIQTSDKCKIKSFSYSDILINSLEIYN